MTSPVFSSRAGGVLVHPSSLPGSFGIGDIGRSALSWIDLLAKSGISYWQMLPVGPTGFGDSPYQSPSSFAGNLNLLSPEAIAEANLFPRGELPQLELPPGPIDYGAVIRRKRLLVKEAWERFSNGTVPSLQPAFEAFLSQNAHWIEDYAVFMALKESQGSLPWWEWPRELAMNDLKAVTAIKTTLAEDVQRHRFGQFLFFQQWQQVRAHARKKGVKLIGDLPIYVALDSADVWAHPELFQLDADRHPLVVAGVPPDYFSKTGQLWGNPLYAWDVHTRTNYAWWIERVRGVLSMVDVVRLDHFRGLEAYWAVPAGDPTAENGQWIKAPGGDLLHALRNALGNLPIIAEDLGVITPEVDALRLGFELPGMRILQFAFGGAVEDRFLPHQYDKNVVVYTGTHDNETTAGWYALLQPDERINYHRYAPLAADAPVKELIRLAWASVAQLAVVPAQDILELGNEARMNQPGIPTGNWRWRISNEPVLQTSMQFLADMGRTYGRS